MFSHTGINDFVYEVLAWILRGTCALNYHLETQKILNLANGAAHRDRGRVSASPLARGAELVTCDRVFGTHRSD